MMMIDDEPRVTDTRLNLVWWGGRVVVQPALARVVSILQKPYRGSLSTVQTVPRTINSPTVVIKSVTSRSSPETAVSRYRGRW